MAQKISLFLNSTGFVIRVDTLIELEIPENKKRNQIDNGISNYKAWFWLSIRLIGPSIIRNKQFSDLVTKFFLTQFLE